jgi:MurNAc alpha-1-phosphate uridylyltransferase
MSAAPEAAMVFAAGRGTRMAPLTLHRPKPLIPVAGRPLVDRALELARAAGARRIVVNLHHLAPLLADHLAGQDLLLSDETDLLLETGGGLRRALPLLGPGPVWTLNCDAVFTGANPLAALARAWRPGIEALLLLVPRRLARGHAGAGDFDLGPDGRLARGAGFVYTGAQIVRTEGLDAVPEAVFSLNRLWDDAAARGGLYGLVHAGGWCDVGRPESIALAERLLREAADVP